MSWTNTQWEISIMPLFRALKLSFQRFLKYIPGHNEKRQHIKIENLINKKHL